MKKTSGVRAVWVVGLCALFLCSGCLGQNHATGHLFKWNFEFENKWAQEGMFLLLLPAYGMCSFGDNIIFNSIYWWSGSNPIDPPRGPGPDDIGF